MRTARLASATGIAAPVQESPTSEEPAAHFPSMINEVPCETVNANCSTGNDSGPERGYDRQVARAAGAVAYTCWTPTGTAMNSSPPQPEDVLPARAGVPTEHHHDGMPASIELTRKLAHSNNTDSAPTAIESELIVPSATGLDLPKPVTADSLPRRTPTVGSRDELGCRANRRARALSTSCGRFPLQRPIQYFGRRRR